MNSGRLIIVCGLPGAGKTTLAKSLESRLCALRLSADEWMDTLDINLWDEPRRAKIEELQWTLAQQLLKLGIKVIIEWGTWGRSERDTLRLGARALGAAVELHYLEVPADVLFERIRQRGMEDPPIERHHVNGGTTRSKRQRLKRWSSSTRRFTKADKVKSIPSEPYPELPLVLESFIVGLQNALKGNLVGVYLVGSLATGDFDLDSDIDFLIVTDAELSDAELRWLQALHIEIHNLDCYPAEHLEGSYISRDLLIRADLVGVHPLWYVDNGSSLLQRSVHDNRWHVRWVLRERAITLVGASPKTLIPPVSVDALRAEMLTSIEKLKTHFVAEIGKPLSYFNTRFGQSFAVLTCCRALHTFQSGTVQSKFSSVQWAERWVKAEWHELIRKAWGERKGVRFGVKVRQPAGVKLLQETAHFISYAYDELSRHQDKNRVRPL